jgi:hypothetical protein
MEGTCPPVSVEGRCVSQATCAGPRDLAGSALVTHSLCQGQEKRKMRNLEIQIGNSGFFVRALYISFPGTKTRALVRKVFWGWKYLLI